MITHKIKKVGKRRSTKRRIRNLSVVLVVVIVIGLIVFRTPILKVNSIKVTTDVDGVVEKSEILESILEQRKADSGIFTTDVKYIFSKHFLENLLVSEYARIKSINLDWSWWNNINILIKERDPYLKVCNSEICYIADNEAFIIDKWQDELLPVLNIETSLEERIFVLNREVAHFLRSIIEYLKTLNVKTDSITLVDESGYKGQIELITEHGTLIKLHPNDDIYATTRLLAIAYLEKFKYEDNENSGNINDITYIDVRFSDFIVFKEK